MSSNAIVVQAQDAQRQAEVRQLLDKVRELEEAYVRVRIRLAEAQRQAADDGFDARSLGIDRAVTVAFANAELRDVVSFLAHHGGISVQFSDEVNQRTQLTFQFSDADFGAVLNYVLGSTQLTARLVGEKSLLIVRRR